MTLVRRIVSAVAAAVALVAVVPASASADTVTQTWDCISAVGGRARIEVRLTVTAPATAAVEQTATVTAGVSRTEPYGAHVPAGYFTGFLEITLGGVASGYLYANDMVSPEIQPDTPWRLENGQGQITFDQPGTVTFTPRRFVVHGGLSWMCGGPSPVAATTQVS
jgi:hypothetical protein